MADVIQAAKWIREGKVVKRPHWLYAGRWDGVRESESKPGELMGRITMSLEDLLADDWEIAHG